VSIPASTSPADFAAEVAQLRGLLVDLMEGIAKRVASPAPQSTAAPRRRSPAERQALRERAATLGIRLITSGG